MKANCKKYILDFKRPSGTSRGVLTQKETWFLILEDNGKEGIGECGLLKGLSFDDVPDYKEKLRWTCDHIHLGKDTLWEQLKAFPSIQFGVEQAFLSLESEDSFELFSSDFTRKESPIAINGLIWMGDEVFMLSQIQKKLKEGFRCIKMKIGAVDFDTEVAILKSIRRTYSEEQIELRVDANGAFPISEALDKLKILADLGIHSIEQPIRPGNVLRMKNLCAQTPLDIALDEELIGISDATQKEKLLQTIQPQYIILKPSLVGGFKGSMEWIHLAEKYNISWWITSALESNIGLNAIAQWTFTLNNQLPQGLGTGSLYINNFDSPLQVAAGKLYYRRNQNWKTDLIKELCI
ncbi:o-succinylbenzoate synthase [Maribacter algarum]|uniref:O-succinylbenzoate synthase n=1 Tax=Maribacter algarum (ex Zhang et al. 2020) TaxID=2578118 RepID=A0A5S3PVI8_9FLAO|nr:o-succinylbenzoate synthase [Maribacter algarum]TMM56988.1 o-succinylbenzoate synthase [Maribacter algarum]